MFLETLTLLLILTRVAAQTSMNITIDDTDPIITYQGSGIESYNSSLAYGGSYMLSNEPWANASFSFKGTAVYFVGLGFLRDSSTLIQLDGGIPNVVVLPQASGANTGPAASTILWAANDLPNQMHTLVVTSGQSLDLITDGFIYTTQTDDIFPPPINVVAIAVPTVIAFAIIIAVVIFIIITIRKRRNHAHTTPSPFADESRDMERQSEITLPAISESSNTVQFISRPALASPATGRTQHDTLQDIIYSSGETIDTLDSLPQTKARFTGIASQRRSSEQSLGRPQEISVDSDSPTTSSSYTDPSEVPPPYCPRQSISSSNPFN